MTKYQQINEGPDKHPIKRIRIRWKEDGSVEIYVRPGPIAISRLELRNRKDAQIQIVPTD